MNEIDFAGFFRHTTYALAGISNNNRKFGNTIYDALTASGKKVFPLHPVIREYKGNTVYPAVAALPRVPDVLVICTKPDTSVLLAKDAAAAGIQRIWFQQGSQSPQALELCHAGGIIAAHAACALMYIEPVNSLHKFHRWVNKLSGRYHS